MGDMGRPITVIAEIGINHNGSMTRASEMIDVAQQAGADVAKFQIYVPERVLDLEDPLIEEHWDTIKAAELSFENVRYLKNLCDTLGIEFLASVFHPDRVKWTEELGMERYKIASRSIYDEALAKAVAVTGKPIIMSWGHYKILLGYPVLINWRRAWARTKHLYCVSKYPTRFRELDFHDCTFGGRYTGFSDHTIGIAASVAAMVLGATIIEKHFTLSRELPGCDQICSIEPDELRQLCEMRDAVEKIL